MPYQSPKQRAYMHSQHPDIAARWDAECAKRGVKGCLEQKVASRPKPASAPKP